MSVSARADCAVVLSCDQAYLPWALFLIRQMHFHLPRRQFDFVIATRGELDLPDWAAGLGIQMHQSSNLPAQVLSAFPAAQVWPLYRLMLPRELAHRYRRLLYLDSDIQMEGGDLDRLLATDLGHHPLGAVLDAPFWGNPNHLAREYRELNLTPRPYLNAGVLLIDTPRYIADGVEERAFEMCFRHPQAVPYADQSILNLALNGQFAQLAPCWNWQISHRLQLADYSYPVFLRHFVGRLKPDRYSGPKLAASYNQAYRDFLAQLMPDRLAGLAPAPDPAPLRLKLVLRMLLSHLIARDVMAEALARHADPYKAIL